MDTREGVDVSILPTAGLCKLGRETARFLTAILEEIDGRNECEIDIEVPDDRTVTVEFLQPVPDPPEVVVEHPAAGTTE